jgi:hypothetical protein
MTMYCGPLNGAWTHIRFWRRGAIFQRSNRNDHEPARRAGAKAHPKTRCPAREGLYEPADLEKAMSA